MTDADVDGSHIRTLLLTFFYRHFREIVELGYLHIAQPPLYRVKKGKKELYLKNEQALEDFLLESAAENLRLRSATRATARTASAATSCAGTPARRRSTSGCSASSTARATRASSTPSCAACVSPRKTFAIRPSWSEGLANLQKQRYFERFAPELVGDEVRHRGRQRARRLQDRRARQGRRRPADDHHRLRADELARIRRPRGAVDRAGGAGESPYVLEHGSEQVEFTRIEELGERVHEIGKKGLAIQRYKGLGEMNPEQLWETTMDPARRTLLQVRVEDAYEADGLFSTLMGDLGRAAARVHRDQRAQRPQPRRLARWRLRRARSAGSTSACRAAPDHLRHQLGHLARCD